MSSFPVGARMSKRDTFRRTGRSQLELNLQVDGCEIYRNAEFIVWSWSSMIAHADGDVFNLAM